MRIALLVDFRSEFLVPDANPRLPVLSRCVTRGDAIDIPYSTFDDCVLGDFGMTRDVAPLAALALAGEGDDPGSDYWLRADPVSLQPTLHRIAGRCLQAGELDWTEAQAFATVLDAHLRPEGCELRLKHPLRWYVRSAKQQMHAQRLTAALLPLDEALLPAGPDAARWQRLMTEAQMLFHATEFNLAREAAGRAPVNGIWCWGGGRIDAPPSRRYDAVFSDDVLALGLAGTSGATARPLANDAALALAQIGEQAGGDVLVALSTERSSSLDAFEANWLTPLLALIENGIADTLETRLLLGTSAVGRRITRKSLRRWWRRTRPFVPHA